MMKINKQITGMLLAFIMLIGLIPSGPFAPAMVSAAMGDVFIAINGNGSTTSYTVNKALPAPTTTGIITIPITESGTYELSGTIEYPIRVSSNVNAVFILNGVTAISDSARTGINDQSPLWLQQSNAAATLVLVDGTTNIFECMAKTTTSNRAQAGINVPVNTTLTIKGQVYNTGKLEARGGSYSAGIGGGPNQASGTIIIEGGQVYAEARSTHTAAEVASGTNGTFNGAGIGSGGGQTGVGAAAGNLTICGDANVTAVSSGTGAAIGGAGSAWSTGGAGGTINIYGNATVTATANGDGAAIGGGSTGWPGYTTSAPGTGGNLTISGNATVVAKSMGAAMDIGSGVQIMTGVNNSHGTITITSGSVHIVNGNASPATNGHDVLEMTVITTAGPYEALSYIVDGMGSTYQYIATSNTANKAYVWMPVGVPNEALISKTSEKIYLAGDGNDETVLLNLTARRGHVLGFTAGIEWFRVSISDTTYNSSNIEANFASAHAAAALVSPDNAGSELSDPAHVTDRNLSFMINADKNARYWIKVNFTNHDGVSVPVYKSIDVDNFYTPIEIFVQDADMSSGTAVIFKQYAKIRTLGDTLYGIPYDLDGTTVLSNPSLLHDTVFYSRNLLMPATHWSLNLNQMPFETIDGIWGVILNENVMNNAYVDHGSPYTDTKRYYTAKYDRDGEWAEVTVYFIQASDGAEYRPDGINSSATFLAPLDFPFHESSYNFYNNGGVFIPPADITGTYEARGWFTGVIPKAVDIATADEHYWTKQNYFELFNPMLAFDTRPLPSYEPNADPPVPPPQGVLADNHKLYIVYGAPAVRITENHLLYGGLPTDTVHPPTNSVVEPLHVEPVYTKKSLTDREVSGLVCVGYEVLAHDGITVEKPFVRFELDHELPPDMSQDGMVTAVIDSDEDGIDFYEDKPIVNFYYEAAVGGIPVSEAGYVTIRWRGEIGNVYVAAYNPMQIVTRIYRDITRTNDFITPDTALPGGNSNHVINGEMPGTKWFYDTEEPENQTEKTVQPTSALRRMEIIFYYSFSTNGFYMDKKQFVLVQYKIDGKNAEIIPSSKVTSFVATQFTATAPAIDGYILMGVRHGDYTGSESYTAGSSYIVFSRDRYTPDEIVTFIYSPAATLHVIHRSLPGSSYNLVFSDYIVTDYDGKMIMLGDGGYEGGWRLDSVYLDDVILASPYEIILDANNPQTVILYYTDLYGQFVIFLSGQVVLGGKQREPLYGMGYTAVRPELDAGIMIELVDLNNRQVLDSAYSTVPVNPNDPNEPNFKFPLRLHVLNSMNLNTGKYVLRFSRMGSNLINARDESYLYSEILLDLTSLDLGDEALATMNSEDVITITHPETVKIILVPGSFIMNSPEKNQVSVADVAVLKALIGVSDASISTTVFNINEYLGVDAADYATVLASIGSDRQKTLGKLTLMNADIGQTVSINILDKSW